MLLTKSLTMQNFKFIAAGYIPTLLFLAWLSSGTVNAQQLDQIGKKGGIKVNGGLGVNQTLYFSNGISDRFVPYSYVVSGNLNFSAYGWSVPLSFAYTNQKLRYNAQPFNIVGISPSYKSLKLHAGFRNMSFSPYTLAGHSFLGGGVEWSHKNFKIAGMGGRLLRGVAYDSTQNTLPVYDRYGGGFKVGYVKKGEEISFITFYAKDEVGSIPTPPSFLGVRPMENQVYSLILKKRLSEKVSFHIEGARSGWTKDIRDSISEEAKYGIRNVFFMPVRHNTVFYSALKTGLTIALKKGAMGMAFERVEPGFRTMGAYFMNSDFQNIAANYSTKLFKDKFSVAVNAGVQRDDLNNEKMSRMNRFVGSASLSMQFSEKLSANGSYSNFNSFTNVRPVDQAFVQNTQFDRLDTMNYVQISQTANVGVNIRLLDNTRLVHNMNIGANYNDVFNKAGETSSVTSMSAAFIGYNINWKESGFSLGGNLNGNRNSFATGESYFFGASLSSRTQFFKKKIKAGLSGNFSTNYEDGVATAYLYSLVNSYSTRIGKKHALVLNLRYTGRNQERQAEHSYYNTSFHEFMGTLGYNFSF